MMGRTTAQAGTYDVCSEVRWSEIRWRPRVNGGARSRPRCPTVSTPADRGRLVNMRPRSPSGALPGFGMHG
jgi:hypothetical protein